LDLHDALAGPQVCKSLAEFSADTAALIRRRKIDTAECDDVASAGPSTKRPVLVHVMSRSGSRFGQPATRSAPLLKPAAQRVLGRSAEHERDLARRSDLAYQLL
jgi:hypothetical protein